MAVSWAPTRVAFLRAINVGGRRLTMDELVEACAGLGVGEIRTWQATGNLVFASDADPRELAQRIEDVLRASLGIAVPAVVRTAEQLVAAMAAPPFADDEVAATEGRTQVLFVRDVVDAATRDAVLAHATDDDPLRFDGAGQLWWLPRAGVSTSSLRVVAIERLLGVCTMRTHGAVQKLIAKHMTG